MPRHPYLDGRRITFGMEFQVVLERDETTRHFTATVPGLPIVVDASSRQQAIRLAREAIELYLEQSGGRGTPSIHAELVTVKVDADVAQGS